MKRRTSEKPSKYEVALGKGDFVGGENTPCPYCGRTDQSESGAVTNRMSKPTNTLDYLMAMVETWERFGMPDTVTLGKLAVWKAKKGDIKETAVELYKTRDGVYKMLGRLCLAYIRNTSPC